MKKLFILGFSASLRNARSSLGAEDVILDLDKIKNRESLNDYLERQGNLHLENYYKAGRDNGVPYDKLYAELRKIGGRKGLSNSEACLVAALWGAKDEGADIGFIPLSNYFRADGTKVGIKELKEKLLKADGIIISTPVYFGDRSSLSQNLIELIENDTELRKSLKGKIYGGLSVGAKRNGGQETTLIYQLHDMMNIGFLGVGNDFGTTAQYGGTGHAGDVGTMSKDEYGINTCIGTGRRVARVAGFMLASRENRLADKLRIGIWTLQDRNGEMLDALSPFLEELRAAADVSLIKMMEGDITACMACDICPSRIGHDDEFRCIRGKTDSMIDFHAEMLKFDVIVPALYSPKDREGLRSVYQHFLERTRYLRRGDYAFTDRLVVPFVLSEVGSNENLNLRMTSSFIRHHTVLQKPIIGLFHKNVLLNPEDLIFGFEDILNNASKLIAGRLAMIAKGSPIALYKPVGYVLSLARDNLPQTMTEREEAISYRVKMLREESRVRSVPINEKN